MDSAVPAQDSTCAAVRPHPAAADVTPGFELCHTHPTAAVATEAALAFLVVYGKGGDADASRHPTDTKPAVAIQSWRHQEASDGRRDCALLLEKMLKPGACSW
uniref:Uncharacterized protein n=1 Tax=Oryza meridionalis TaxID=40149 RepID=A0A0E0FB20_9ORYZ